MLIGVNRNDRAHLGYSKSTLLLATPTTDYAAEHEHVCVCVCARENGGNYASRGKVTQFLARSVVPLLASTSTHPHWQAERNEISPIHDGAPSERQKLP